MSRAILLVAATLLPFSGAQFPPEPEGLKTVKSKFHEGVTISYKEPGICETTPGVKSYSGYVSLPPGQLDEPTESQNYPINTFFWFFEARKDPHNAPLSIWLNGGPGGSSLWGLAAENGPCFIGNDSNSTYLNPWSWNNEVNMLYIDQPVQVGFSYDVLTNITADFWDADGFMGTKITVNDFSDGVPAQNNTFLVGTSGSQKMSHTANSTHHAAVALWHFAQTWFEEFPHYKPATERISLWTESYGGKYGPAFYSFFQRQNDLIRNGTISGPGVHYLHLDTLGIVNGCIDMYHQHPFYTDFAFNNTYGLKVINESWYHYAMHEVTKKGGVQDKVLECRRLAQALDPEQTGNVEEVNKFCSEVTELGWRFSEQPFEESGSFARFDVTHSYQDSFPPDYFSGYFNQHHVQRALGVPVNYTFASGAVSLAFEATGDFVKGGLLSSFAYLLDSGVKVAMMYGDRDWACNWKGGEAASLAIPNSMVTSFSRAGYAPIALSPFKSGGLVRQLGPQLSFSRIYQAGHMVPSYQPEAAYEVFMRAVTNRDVATGQRDVENDWWYQTEGLESAWRGVDSDILDRGREECYILMPGSTCERETWEGVKEGRKVVKDWIVVGDVDSESQGQDQDLALGLGGETWVGEVGVGEGVGGNEDGQAVLAAAAEEL